MATRIKAPFAGPLAKQNRLRVARALLAFAPDLQEDARVEVLEFIAGQVSSGALPTDPELMKSVLELAATTSSERSDRAWLALIMRSKPKMDRLLAQRDSSAARPRVRWRVEALLERHNDAIRHFFTIQNPSETDVDEFFEYLRTRLEADDSLSLESHLAALIRLKPRAAAALMPDSLLDSVADKLEPACDRTLEFGECLLETGRLKGDAAATHLKALCAIRPDDVSDFLQRNPGVVRPEDALSIVRAAKLGAAEALCLEAAGDPAAALEAMLRGLASADPDAAARCVSAAAALCARAGGAAPRAQAAAMWARLLRAAPRAEPALLLEAAAYVPVETLLARAESTRGALALVACAESWRRAWRCAGAVAAKVHDSIRFKYRTPKPKHRLIKRRALGARPRAGRRAPPAARARPLPGLRAPAGHRRGGAHDALRTRVPRVVRRGGGVRAVRAARARGRRARARAARPPRPAAARPRALARRAAAPRPGRDRVNTHLLQVIGNIPTLYAADNGRAVDVGDIVARSYVSVAEKLMMKIKLHSVCVKLSTDLKFYLLARRERNVTRNVMYLTCLP
ncbi:uncharacterized protein LOC114364170 [Ostrinia furnacalis]|uniref:uncharacterized protein LOC114364170 n=1 Tax=Ostrinia furnacalis TaxID=93504 RepID=UPI00103CD6BF|nr:uncharacterized protein LOC114364170 [Ostrinia furnacalis]